MIVLHCSATVRLVSATCAEPMLAELQNAKPHTTAAGGSGTLWVRHSITYSDGVAALRNAHIAQPRT